MVLPSIDPSAFNHSNVCVESVLRLRPLSKKEAEDTIVLEQVQSIARNAPATVVLNPPLHGAPMASPIAGTSNVRGRSESDATANNTPTEYHFNQVLADSTSQDKIYYTLGLPIATAAMNSLKTANHRSSGGPKSHVLVCMGVAGSGKTYTCLGGTTISKRRASQDGLVPRLVDSLFSQSKHHTSTGTASKGFAVLVSMAQVTHTKGVDPHECAVHDLLNTGAIEKPKEKKKMTPKRNLTVRGMAAKFERAIGSPIRSPLRTSSSEVSELDADNMDLFVEECTDVTQAREVLQKGLTNSTKVAKGQNHHLLITLQPVSDGTQLGDKIAILDMAGLEKGRKCQNRGKDSVANKNQEASAAVLHCLRTMIHNTNIRSGKADAIDVVDDTVSEISSVSQEKDPLRRQLKPVPFRQHKVTMLLQSVFTQSVSSKVTLLLTAYPGHADYHEKRMLLQDMELLCGVALVGTREKLGPGFDRSDSKSVVSTESRSNYGRSGTFDEDDTSQKGAVRGFKMPESSYQNSSSSQSLALSASIYEGDETPIQPPAYAPSYAKSFNARKGLPVPTAPPLDVHHQPTPLPVTATRGGNNQTKVLRNPDYVSDFPGVHLPAKKDLSNPISERQRVTSVHTASNVGGRLAPFPPPADSDALERDIMKRQPVVENEGFVAKQFLPESKHTRQPLGRSSLENGTTFEDAPVESMKSATKKFYQNKDVSSSPMAFEAISAPRQGKPTSEGDRPSRNVVGEKSTNDKVATTKENRPRSEGDMNNHTNGQQNRDILTNNADQKVRELERKMQELERAKQIYERKCSELEGENEKLRKSVKQAVAQAQSQWTAQDEEYFQRCREARIEDQNLVKKTFRNHMERVNYIYDIKNQWCKTDKPHFGLTLPSHFQRATELDIRDKEWEAREGKLGGNDSKMLPVHSVLEKEKKKPSPIKTYRPKRSVKSVPSPLAALKKLTMNF